MIEIECKNISFSYSEKFEILKDISIKFTSKESIGLIGKNGSGKTTFLKILLGILKSNSGELYWNNKKISGFNETKKFANIVPENSKLFLIGPTVIDDLTKIVNDRERAYSMLKDYNLEGLAGKKIYHLSEGQRRLIAIFNALHQAKDIFILDEPTIGLDYGGITLMLDLINKLINNDKIVVVATNDVRILPYFKRLVGIKDGRISLDGPPHNVLFRLSETMEFYPNQITRLVGELKSEIKFPDIITHRELNDYLNKYSIN